MYIPLHSALFRIIVVLKGCRTHLVLKLSQSDSLGLQVHQFDRGNKSIELLPLVADAEGLAYIALNLNITVVQFFLESALQLSILGSDSR